MRADIKGRTGDELERFIESAARNFMNTELALGLQSNGIELERLDARSNYERSHKIHGSS